MAQAHILARDNKEKGRSTRRLMRPFVSLLLIQFLIFGLLVAPVPVRAQTSTAASITPIKHLVVIFQENISFDHYFGTYPVAANPEGLACLHGAAEYALGQWVDGCTDEPESQFRQYSQCNRSCQPIPAGPLPGRHHGSEP